jgi:hypothetical protein
MGACQSVSSSSFSPRREWVLMGSPTRTVLAAATTIAIGAVVLTPLGDIQVEVSKQFLFPPDIHHTPLPPCSDPEDVFVCESRVSGSFLAPAYRKPFRVFCSSHPLPILLQDQ